MSVWKLKMELLLPKQYGLNGIDSGWEETNKILKSDELENIGNIFFFFPITIINLKR